MPTPYHSVQATNKVPCMSPSGANNPVVAFGDYVIPAANILNDIVEMVQLPANCVLIDLTLDAPSLDTATGVVTAVGLMSGAWGANGVRTMTADYVVGSIVGRSGAGGIQKPNVPGFSLVAPSTVDRSIGIKFTTAATTAAVVGSIRLTVWYRPVIDAV